MSIVEYTKSPCLDADFHILENTLSIEEQVTLQNKTIDELKKENDTLRKQQQDKENEMKVFLLESRLKDLEKILREEGESKAELLKENQRLKEMINPKQQTATNVQRKPMAPVNEQKAKTQVTQNINKAITKRPADPVLPKPPVAKKARVPTVPAQVTQAKKATVNNASPKNKVYRPVQSRPKSQTGPQSDQTSNPSAETQGKGTDIQNQIPETAPVQPKSTDPPVSRVNVTQKSKKPISSNPPAKPIKVLPAAQNSKKNLNAKATTKTTYNPSRVGPRPAAVKSVYQVKIPREDAQTSNSKTTATNKTVPSDTPKLSSTGSETITVNMEEVVETDEAKQEVTTDVELTPTKEVPVLDSRHTDDAHEYEADPHESSLQEKADVQESYPGEQSIDNAETGVECTVQEVVDVQENDVPEPVENSEPRESQEMNYTNIPSSHEAEPVKENEVTAEIEPTELQDTSSPTKRQETQCEEQQNRISLDTPLKNDSNPIIPSTTDCAPPTANSSFLLSPDSTSLPSEWMVDSLESPNLQWSDNLSLLTPAKADTSVPSSLGTPILASCAMSSPLGTPIPSFPMTTNLNSPLASPMQCSILTPNRVPSTTNPDSKIVNPNFENDIYAEEISKSNPPDLTSQITTRYENIQ